MSGMRSACKPMIRVMLGRIVCRPYIWYVGVNSSLTCYNIKNEVAQGSLEFCEANLVNYQHYSKLVRKCPFTYMYVCMYINTRILQTELAEV